MKFKENLDTKKISPKRGSKIIFFVRDSVKPAQCYIYTRIFILINNQKILLPILFLALHFQTPASSFEKFDINSSVPPSLLLNFPVFDAKFTSSKGSVEFGGCQLIDGGGLPTALQRITTPEPIVP